MTASSKRDSDADRRRAPLQARRAKPSPAGVVVAPPPAPRPTPPAGLEDADGQWMSQAAAAEAAGVGVTVVRKWRREGTIAERPSPQRSGSVEVFLASSRHSPDGAATAPASSGGEAREVTSELGVLVPLEVHQRSLAELILRLTDTTERAVRAEARVELLEARLAEFSVGAQPADGIVSQPSRRRKKG